jgi:dipeptide/tripeptide permease
MLMMYLLFKYAITSFLIVFISEVAKRSDKLGGLIAALPLVTVLVLFWLYFEKQGTEKIANHAWYTFWYVIPTLPMFLIFPYVIKHYGFWPAMVVSIVITVLSFVVFASITKKFGIHLM